MDFDSEQAEMSALKFSLALAKCELEEDPKWNWIDSLDQKTIDLIGGLWMLFMDTYANFLYETGREHSPEEAIEVYIVTHPNAPTQEEFESLLPVVQEYFEIEEL